MVKINLNNKEETDKFYNQNKCVYQKLSSLKNLNLKNRLRLSKISLNMAFINEYRNNIDESIEYYNKSYQLNRCSRSSYSLGKIFYYKKEYDKALKYFLDSAIFNNESAYFMAAKIYYLKKDFKNCEDNLIKASKLGDIESIFILSKFYYNKGLYDKAYNYAIKLIDNENDELRNTILTILVLVKCNQKKFNQALLYHNKLDDKFKENNKKIIESFKGEFFDFE